MLRNNLYKNKLKKNIETHKTFNIEQIFKIIMFNFYNFNGFIKDHTIYNNASSYLDI